MTASCRTFPVSGAVAVAAGLVLSGCMKNLPTAPSELTNGVTIYEHADFAGASALVTGDLGDLKDFHGPCPGEVTPGGPGFTPSFGDPNWNDCMSSLKVAPGWRHRLP